MTKSEAIETLRLLKESIVTEDRLGIYKAPTSTVSALTYALAVLERVDKEEREGR